MPQQSKRFGTAKAKVELGRRYTLAEAAQLVKESATAKFNESVDAAIRLGVDPRHADQMVRGACSLPHGIGKQVRILVFAQGEAARIAEEAGADVVGGAELVEKVLNENFLDFDKAIAARDMMGQVGKLGRVLGPRGLMPNPKVGTVVGPEAIAATIKDLRGGKIDFRVSPQELTDNLLTLISTLLRLKPSTAKGTYLKSIAISSTMGPGVRIDASEAQRAAEGL